MSADADTPGERLGLAVWGCEAAGPLPTSPHPGPRWPPEGPPAPQPHADLRNGTAQVRTLLHPADGRVRVAGVSNCPNEVLHPWLQRALSEVLAGLPEPPPAAQASRAAWQRWQQGPSVQPSRPAERPPFRRLLVLDNRTGHQTPELLRWRLARGLRPRYTPRSGSWLNRAEGIQRILQRRAVAGQHPGTPAQIRAWFAAVAEHWDQSPTPFAWGGQRQRRRQRQRERRHRAGGSGAYTRRPVARRSRPIYGHTQSK